MNKKLKQADYEISQAKERLEHARKMYHQSVHNCRELIGRAEKAALNGDDQAAEELLREYDHLRLLFDIRWSDLESAYDSLYGAHLLAIVTAKDVLRSYKK